ncbi:MAG: MGMT family protein [Mariniblastus sp.]|nr:MGMT family protein [Mariniblastus sp.]
MTLPRVIFFLGTMVLEMTIPQANFIALDPKCGPTRLSVFQTALGWLSLLHCEEVIRQIKFGFQSRTDSIAYFDNPSDPTAPVQGKRVSYDRISGSPPSWKERFIQYTNGEKISFADLLVDISGLTKFQTRVLKECRGITYGQVLTYGELATKCGSPGAARAVGSAMKSNWTPIVIPCHRIIRADGLGNFSASQGMSTKARMLTMEGARWKA